MVEFLEGVLKVAVLVFVVTCMAAAGLGLSAQALVAPFRRPRLVIAAVIANFVVAPALAYGLTELVKLDRPHAIGLLLLAGAAGAPFLPKLAELAKGDLAFSIGLVLLFTAGSAVFMPFVLPLLMPELSAEPWPLLQPLLFTMLLPLAVGMVVKNRSEQWSARLRTVLTRVSNISMVLTVVLLVGLNFRAILGTFGSGAVAVAVVFVALATAAGFALGGPTAGTRSVLALGTGQRNVAAALLVATQNFPDEPGVVVMLLVSTLAGLVVLLPAGRWFARRASEVIESRSVPIPVSLEERQP
ncbi:bile acid:sodium symporter : Bile acid:sodium symporter, BASS family OS=gamma proteobacterium Hiromi1 GN=TBH_C2172 PE=4 SV=1: SBF [Gemmata massiliana]|uniref:Bile acid:sodium symporter n=1 Tax=Gemmata massiliana TaxID=1210884 RepID=A0A6P2D741_9BACT|nr:bile acid:sodium symporter [Gemmata massiliana]VTR97131.1 bile acid:sodium symporter : Bile acid:sodium symporter, BASS family OS=gamma proteobacterium Hiromi1 GN=TBH_C2172 PE=4 SV=1: SBF [Gemmata massiliana]